MYIGAWRAGKTYAGCQEALKKSFLYPNNCGLIGRKDYCDLRDTTIKTFFEVCPADFIKSYNKTEHHVVFVNGSELYFRELKDGQGLGSLNLGWFYIDEAEEVEETIFERLKGRLSLQDVGKPQGWLTSNPPNEDHWLFKHFEETDDPEHFTIHATTYENKEYLPDDYIEELEKLPPSWRKKYLEGQYGFTPDGTAYYSGYTEPLHKQTNLTVNTAFPLICGWDFGFRHPAFVVTQWDKKRWRILAEILGTDITIAKFIDFHVKPLLSNRFPKSNYLHFGDPACMQVNDKSEFTSYQILQSKGIDLKFRQSEYRQRQEIINKMINTIENGLPMLLVDSSCKIINDGFLGGYHYPVRKDGQEFGVKHELPFRDGFYEHLMNALEYIAVNIFSPIENKRQPYRPKKVKARDNI